MLPVHKGVPRIGAMDRDALAERIPDRNKNELTQTTAMETQTSDCGTALSVVTGNGVHFQ